MKKRTLISKRLKIMLAPLLAAAATASDLAADDQFSRNGKTDIYGLGQYLNGNHFDGYSGGFGVGYHFSDNVAVNTEGTLGALRGEQHGLIYSGLVSVEYDIFRSRFTPFIAGEGGIVVQQVATRSFGTFLAGTRELTHGAFGGGVGLRWDITDHFFMKTAYHALEITHRRSEGL